VPAPEPTVQPYARRQQNELHESLHPQSAGTIGPGIVLVVKASDVLASDAYLYKEPGA
jgi:hypothetical protein